MSKGWSLRTAETTTDTHAVQFTRCRVSVLAAVNRHVATIFTRPVDYAITHNLTPSISMQNLYNLLYREEEREMMPTLKVRTSPASLLSPTEHSVPLE